MNERIRELSEQAEKYADDNFRGEPTWSEAFESKFAELIVRECMDVLDPGENQVIARFQARQWLAEHFGVEE
jgi:hypothetical protein